MFSVENLYGSGRVNAGAWGLLIVGGVYSVECACLGVDESSRWVGYEWTFLYVFVSALAFEAYYLASASDSAPSSGVAVDGLVVYVP